MRKNIRKFKKKLTTLICMTALALPLVLVPEMQVKAETTVPIYRLYNPDNGEHLYTTDANETRVLYEEHNWGYEGVAWYAPSGTGTPVYRLYNPVLCNHLYTTDTNEVHVLTTTTEWISDNNGQPVFYSDGSIPVYRVYNKELQGMHHLTTDRNEYDTLPTYGWEQEGVSLYAKVIGSPIITQYWNESGAELSLPEGTTGSSGTGGSSSGGTSSAGSNEHIHDYKWVYVADGDYKVNKCDCGEETGERAYNLGNGVYGQWKDNMAAELMTCTNNQRANTWTNPIDAGGNYLGVRQSQPLNNTLSDKAKTRALECVYNYSHDRLYTEDECLAKGYKDARSVSSAWMASSDHGPAMCDYRYTQGGTACLWYDEDGNGTMNYIWVLTLDY